MRDLNPHKPSEEDQSKEFKLPDSPWTLGRDGFNPNLRPSNTQLRQRKPNGQSSVGSRSEDEDASRYKAVTQTQNYPPYHPSYRAERSSPRHRSSSPASSDSAGTDDSANEFQALVRPDASERVRARLGAEGWEVRQPGFRLSDGEDSNSNTTSSQRRRLDPLLPPDRYRRYISDDPSSEESEAGENSE